ncbi:MAG: hypothetical protein M3246_08720, partial [Actinomycetota bacterium]|nr:hypothetical protein [Actinomycetota bacterium]
RQLDAGTISPEEFDAQLRQLMVQDDEGRWWAKSRKTGEWNYHDGSAWVRGTPPGYQQPPPPMPPAESTPDLQSQSEQGEQLPLSQTTFFKGKRRLGVRRWIVTAAGLVLVGMGVLVGIGIIVEGSNRALTYDLIEDDSGKLSVEVPSEWNEHITTESEGERGRNWSSFLGERAGPSLAAVNGIEAWRSGARGHKGTYMVASKKLAQRYTDDELIALGPNDYSSSCEAGTRQDFDRPPYSGKIQQWDNCGGESDHTAVTLAAAPEDRECVVVSQIGGYLQDDEESIQHIFDTFEADCRGID